MRESFKIPCFMLFCLGVLCLCVSSTCTLVTSPQVTSTGLVPPHWSRTFHPVMMANVMSGIGGGVAEDDIWWWGDLSQLDIFDHQLSHWQCVCVCVCLACVLIHHEENAPSAIHTSGEGASKGHAGCVLCTSSSLFPSRWSTYLPIILTASTSLAVRPSRGVQNDSTEMYQHTFTSEKWSEGQLGKVSIGKAGEEEKDNKDQKKAEFEIRSLCSVNFLLGFGLCGSSPHHRHMVVTTERQMNRRHSFLMSVNTCG